MKAIRIFYGALWLFGIGVVGLIAYQSIAPAAQVIVTTLHNLSLDNRGLHE